jgi:signal transduction histidine kinase
MLAIDELKLLQVFRNIIKNTFFFWEDLEKAVIILFVKSQYNNSRFLFEALTVK